MPDLRQDRATLGKFSGLALGIMLGSLLGPIVFGPIGMGPAAAASVGCFAGALVGYLLVSLTLLIARHRQNAELGLEGTVHSTVEASQAEDLAWNTPGVVDVENRLEVAA